MNRKKVIITGASTGIGQNLAMQLAGLGFDVGLLARRGKLLEKLQGEILTRYPQGTVLFDTVDVGHEQELDRVLRKMIQDLGGLDLFIANAGIGSPTPGWRPCWKDIKNILQVNVMGAIQSLEIAKEWMLQQNSGHLVGISSVAYARGLPETSAYCTSKAALTTYLESTRIDLSQHPICVTSIHPGFIATPMTAKNKHPMPFLLDADEGSRRILQAILKKKKRYFFPWPMALVVGFLRHLPGWLYDFLMTVQKRSSVFHREK